MAGKEDAMRYLEKSGDNGALFAVNRRYEPDGPAALLLPGLRMRFARLQLAIV